MRTKILAAALLSMLAACATADFDPRAITEVVVQDFDSREPEACTTADVDLDGARVRAFFERAQPLPYRTLVERYPIAPCALLGSLRLDGRWCDWKIRPGATGEIDCAGERRYFACEGCDDLYVRPPQR